VDKIRAHISGFHYSLFSVFSGGGFAAAGKNRKRAQTGRSIRGACSAKDKRKPFQCE